MIIEPIEENPEDENGVRGILYKEEAELDPCRCGSYCGEYSPEIFEEVTADSIGELVERAARYLPVCAGHMKSDAEPHLYLVIADLSAEVQTAFAERVRAKKAAEEEKAHKEEAAKRIAADRAKLKRLEAAVHELESGDELARLRRDLAETRAWRGRGSRLGSLSALPPHHPRRAHDPCSAPRYGDSLPGLRCRDRPPWPDYRARDQRPAVGDSRVACGGAGTVRGAAEPRADRYRKGRRGRTMAADRPVRGLRAAGSEEGCTDREFGVISKNA